MPVHQTDALETDLLADRCGQQGWATPLTGFEAAFITRMLESKQNFAQALGGSGVEILVPRQDYTIRLKTSCP